MTIVGMVLVIVSGVQLIVQTVVLRRISRQRPTRQNRRMHGGLVRTVTCRVVVALAYLCLGVVTLTVPELPLTAALAVFTVAQIVWQANSLADMRLRRRVDM